jgi:hypothetical protein
MDKIPHKHWLTEIFHNLQPKKWNTFTCVGNQTGKITNPFKKWAFTSHLKLQTPFAIIGNQKSQNRSFAIMVTFMN